MLDEAVVAWRHLGAHFCSYSQEELCWQGLLKDEFGSVFGLAGYLGWPTSWPYSDRSPVQAVGTSTGCAATKGRILVHILHDYSSSSKLV